MVTGGVHRGWERRPLTDAAVRKLRLRDGERQAYVKDGGTVGLYLRVGKTFRSYVYRYRSQSGRMREITIGPAGHTPGALSLAQAREEAARLRILKRSGKDPLVERRRETAATFGALAQEYIDHHAPKKRTGASDLYRIERYILPLWKDRPLTEVTRRDVVKLLDRWKGRGKNVMARHIQGLVSRIYTFGAERGLVEPGFNPTFGVRSEMAGSRTRVLDDAEMARFWLRLPDCPIEPATAIALKLILLTGARPGELRAMAKAEIEDDLWRIPASRYKTGREHTVPLPPMARALIQEAWDLSRNSPFLFPGRGDGPLARGALGLGVRRSLATLGIESFTPHDLRRSARTAWAKMGIEDGICERLLGHQVGTKMTRVYLVHDFNAEKLAVLEAWEKRLTEIIPKAQRMSRPAGARQ